MTTTIPYYTLSYAEQEDGREYVRGVSNLSSLIEVIQSILNGICAELYQLDTYHTNVDVDLLTTLSNLSQEELATINYTSVLNSHKSYDEFVHGLIDKCDIVGNGYYDGWEWTHIHFIKRLATDSTFLASASTAKFYEYVVDNPTQFVGNTVCASAITTLAVIYPNGYDEMYYSAYDQLVQLDYTYAQWNGYYTNLNNLLLLPTLTTEELGINLIKYLVLMSPVQTTSQSNSSASNLKPKFLFPA